MDIKKKDGIEKSILLVPLFMAFLWMGFLVFDTQAPEPGVSLAPSSLDTLINVLFGFIVVYAVILVFLFYKMNKDLKRIEKTAKKPLKKKAKKKKN